MAGNLRLQGRRRDSYDDGAYVTCALTIMARLTTDGARPDEMEVTSAAPIHSGERKVSTDFGECLCAEFLSQEVITGSGGQQQPRVIVLRHSSPSRHRQVLGEGNAFQHQGTLSHTCQECALPRALLCVTGDAAAPCWLWCGAEPGRGRRSFNMLHTVLDDAAGGRTRR